jgi:hypothetical protein
VIQIAERLLWLLHPCSGQLCRLIWSYHSSHRLLRATLPRLPMFFSVAASCFSFAFWRVGVAIHFVGGVLTVSHEEIPWCMPCTICMEGPGWRVSAMWFTAQQLKGGNCHHVFKFL